MSSGINNRDIALSVRGLSKVYTIAQNEEKHVTLAEAALHRLKNPFQCIQKESFWALKDIDFDVQKGDVVGIIGRNGAGKSTLLKILSRITEPTMGEINLYGRVGSLLEVGTGFHPELTGRENIYLNGAILGMRRREIDRQFDAIVEFAEVAAFLDTPVKRYSSGMYVRLAFAVAAHLNPEILIVDEVLAVGDSEFQKKCIGKMQDVAKGGRTVLFVSHNMAAIDSLCNSAILLNRGGVEKIGKVRPILNHYLSRILPDSIKDVSLEQRKDRSGNGKVILTSFHVEDIYGNRIETLLSGMEAIFVFGYRSCETTSSPVDIGISVSTSAQTLLFVLYSSYTGKQFNQLPTRGEFRCSIQNLPLGPGKYIVGSRITVGTEEADWPKEGVGYIEVESGNFYGTGSLGFNAGTPFMVNGNWDLSPISPQFAMTDRK